MVEALLGAAFLVVLAILAAVADWLEARDDRAARSIDPIYWPGVRK